MKAVINDPATGKTEAELLQKGLNEFYRDGRLVSSIDGFDQAQRALRALYESADSNTRRVLGGLRRDLVDAVDLIKGRGVGEAYQAARRSHFDARRMDEAYNLGVKGPAEVEDFLGRYNALRNEAERKLTRLGLWKHYDDRMARLKPTDDVTNIFKQRDLDVLAGVIPRTTTAKRGIPKGEFGDRPERFGRWVESERRMIATRNEVVGNSKTQQRAVDDEQYRALTGIEELKEVFANRGITAAGLKVLERMLTTVFGMRQDTSAAIARQLFTADPKEIQRVLINVRARMGRSRFDEFTQLLGRYQTALQGAGIRGAISTGPAVERP